MRLHLWMVAEISKASRFCQVPSHIRLANVSLLHCFLWKLWITLYSVIFNYYAPQSCNPLVELYTNHWMLTIIRKPRYIYITIHKHSEVCFLHHGIKLQQLAMLWKDTNVLRCIPKIQIFSHVINSFLKSLSEGWFRIWYLYFHSSVANSNGTIIVYCAVLSRTSTAPVSQDLRTQRHHLHANSYHVQRNSKLEAISAKW